jgi:hypothetical protein
LSFFGRLLTLAICFQLSKCFVEPFVCHFGLLTIGILRGLCKPSGRHELPVDSLARIEQRMAGQQVERCRKLTELGEMVFHGEGAMETQRLGFDVVSQ